MGTLGKTFSSRNFRRPMSFRTNFINDSSPSVPIAATNNVISSGNIRSSSFYRKPYNFQVNRTFHPSSKSWDKEKTVPIIFIDPMGKEIEVDAQIGKHLLDVAHDNNIELEGACGAELACATCHLIFEKDAYDKLDEKDPEEDDMLDMAFDLTDTSRLGCQITVREDMSGMKVTIPDDGY